MTWPVLELWAALTLGTILVYVSKHWWQSSIESNLGVMSSQWIAEQGADASRHRPY